MRIVFTKRDLERFAKLPDRMQDAVCEALFSNNPDESVSQTGFFVWKDDKLVVRREMLAHGEVLRNASDRVRRAVRPRDEKPTIPLVKMFSIRFHREFSVRYDITKADLAVMKRVSEHGYNNVVRAMGIYLREYRQYWPHSKDGSYPNIRMFGHNIRDLVLRVKEERIPDATDDQGDEGW